MFLFSIFCFTIEKRKRQQINHLQLRWRAKSEKLKCCFSVLLIFLFFCFLFVVNKHILYLWFIHLVLHYRICHCFDQVSLQLAATAKSSTKRPLKMILRGVVVVLTFLLPKRCLTGSQKWLLKQGLANDFVFRKGTKAGDIIQMAVEFIPMNIEYRVVLGASNQS